MSIQNLSYFFFNFIPKKKYLILILLSLIVTFLEAFSIAAILPIFINDNNDFENNILIYFSDYIKFYGFYIFLLIILIRFFFQALSLIYETNLISFVAKEIQFKIIKKFLEKNLLINDNINKVLREITTDTISISMIIKHSTIIIAEVFVLVLLSLFILINSTLNIIYSILICILLLMIIFIYIRNKILIFSQQRAKSAKDRIFQINYFLNNFYVIKSLGDFSKPLKIISKETKKFFKNWKKLIIFINLSKPSIELIFGFIIVSILIFNSNDLRDNMLASLIAIIRIIPSISRISTSFQSINSFIPLINNIKVSLNQDNNNLYKINVHTTDRGKIQLNNLNFNMENRSLLLSYQNKETKKIKKIIINKKGLIVLRGASGIGKTSFLLDILLGLSNIDKNKKLNRLVSYMPQEVRLSKSNLEYDLTSLNLSNEKMMNDKTFLKVKKNLFNNTLDAYYKNKQNEFSGGEEKRLGYLRSILDNPAILILDEPTENLDVSNEKIIIDEIFNQSKKGIVIVSSHNETFLENATEVINFDK